MKAGKSIYLFLIPGLILYLMFFIYPTLSALFYSFTNWDGLTADFDFVGMANYVEIFTKDSIFKKAFVNNLEFMLFVVIFQTLFSLVFALMLTKNSTASIFLRALYFFPTILSSVSVAFIWTYMYDPNLGLINKLLDLANLEFLTMNWIGDGDIAIYSISAVQVWFHTGQMLIIFVAGLQGIPKDLYEVAKMEGANKWQTFRKVTWPLVAPAATIVVAYTTIQSFKAFDLIFAMTRGGPNYSTEILATLIYNTAFRSYRFGYASAESVIFMIVIAIITFTQMRLLRSRA
ncbi:ABC transporter permease [Thalassobacillus devorans]|uniref:ABC transporter permease n=1 Tax=Thalassobacillus devorans TaxID=279813 RepID=A0ABQ1NUR0_9BACI|nr:sugar ABC transporter permease [Thalassobacillus devorans]NIK28554.1 raffinose/stachyose/melibiose transport system permease protein [Thalassobacillus devorans]GGC85318.1 ABC transporter permease [Thalassobacillus devorans]